MARRPAVAVATVLLASLMLVGPAAAAADREVVAIMWHPQTAMTGTVGVGAAASLVRRNGGVSFTFSTTNLRPGHAYTVWFVVVNNPAACAASPCSGPDILLNPATDAQVTYGAGHIAGASGTASFAGSFRVGSIDGWLPNGALRDPWNAEFQLVLNDHGPKLQGYLPDMIQTYRAGCTEASIPGIFPASARADGQPGPNACQLYQMAAFADS